MGPALVIMSKLPIPGKTKTRLIGKMSPEECAAFHLACVKDIANLVKGINLPSYLYVTGSDYSLFQGKELTQYNLDQFGLSEAELDQFTIRPQIGKELGERISNIFREQLIKHDRVLVIGADIPGILPEEILTGLKNLEHSDVTLGPSEDGGYYLIGMRKYYSKLFRDIHWGTDQVLNKTLAQGKGLGLSVAFLPLKLDIDTWDDFSEYYRRSSLSAKKTLDDYVTKFMTLMIGKYDLNSFAFSKICGKKSPI